MHSIPLVDEFRLVALIDNPSERERWDRRAACAGLPGGLDAFFPADGDVPPAYALICCLGCPVACECLATALINEVRDGDRHGWWGGVGPTEREILARRLGLPATGAETELPGPAGIARQLRLQNFTIPSIAAELGCTERTVYRYLAATAA